jgi:hypothetical protein
MANREIRKYDRAYKVEIFIGCDDLQAAFDICESYCTEIGLCVTVMPTMYFYRGGHCEGIVVGLINYARFPALPLAIWNKAHELAERLKIGLTQGSYTIQDHHETMFVSTRDEDQ